MGEATCLLQPSFSTQLRDPLSGSISFGRFMCDSDSLTLDKWSNLSHKRYVEEAAKYSKPGSVAQKKAFFEDYYKKKALLAQQNAEAAAVLATVTQDEESSFDNIVTEVQNKDKPSAEHEAIENIIIESANFADVGNGCQPEISKPDLELSTATTETSENSEMEKPLLKDRNSNEEVSSGVRKHRPPAVPSSKPVASLWPSAKSTTTNPCPPPKPVNRSRKENVTPANNITTPMESIRMSPKPLFSYMSRTPGRDAKQCAANSLKGGKDSNSITPLRTPSLAHQQMKSSVTPKSDNRRNMTPIESGAIGSKTTGAKWRYFGGLDFSMCLSATCRNKLRPSPTASSPFNFRTEERAIKRKEKLESKFDAKAPQKVQLQTKLKEKAECELKKLRQSLCFRARPLPSFYKERKTPKDEIIPTNPAEAPVLSKLQQTRRIGNDVRKGGSSGTLPPPPPIPQTQRPTSSYKNKAMNISGTKKSNSKGLTHPRSLATMISKDNDLLK